jgi:type IV secretion system protein VirB8
MTGQSPERKAILEQEMFYGVRKRERFAWVVGIGGVLIGILSLSVVLVMLPLKQTEAFLAIVDKDTGVAERVVSVEKAGVSQSEAIVQALLYSYVTDRETYDEFDNEKRILRAYTWSEGPAKTSLTSLWDEANPNYPPLIYGESAKAEIMIISITPVTEATAQVRYTKTLRAAGSPDKEGKFTATVTYTFKPTKEAAIDLVWQNPTGFTVSDYRVTAEAFETGNN